MASTAAWVIGGVLVAGAVGTAIYFATKKDETAKALPQGAPPPPKPGGYIADNGTNVPELNALADLASQLNLPINSIDWSVPPPPPLS